MPHPRPNRQPRAPRARASGFRLPAVARRGPRLPGVEGLAPRSRSPGACPSPATDSPAEPAPPRPSDPPPVLSGSLPEPLSPRQWRSGPEAGRIDFLPRADSHRGKTPQGGGRAAVIHVKSIAAPKRRQKVGRNGTAADRGRALPAPVRPLRSAPRDAHATLADSHRWDAGASRRRGLARPCRMPVSACSKQP